MAVCRAAYRDLRRVNRLFARNPKYRKIPLVGGRGRPLMMHFTFLTRAEVARVKAEPALRAPGTTPEGPQGGGGAD